jgi:hypothetical protein
MRDNRVDVTPLPDGRVELMAYDRQGLAGRIIFDSPEKAEKFKADWMTDSESCKREISQ